MTLITDTPSLAAFCQRVARAPFITVDTEFMREKTYWPKLCLVQVAGGGMDHDPDSAVAVDALAPGIDLEPLFALLDDPGVVKVFHAARQDLEIFYHLTGRLPKPVFDTQIAAMVCGFGDSVGYETLITTLTKARIDKASRFTDWSVRPLSERQIVYAIADVTHLRAAYEKLKRRLGTNGREAWLKEEMATLTAPATYAVEPAEAYRRIKARGNRRFMAVLREVAAWREREARRRDIPRNWVLRDEALVEIAHHAPKTPAQLARTRGLGPKLAEGPAGADILAAVAAGLALPDHACPELDEKDDLPKGIGPMAELLKVLLKMKSEESGVAQKLLASSADVDRIAAFGEDAQVPALHGWRRQVFGEDALRLRRGEIALAVEGKHVKVVMIRGDAGF
jgi:ribonuclease D